MRINRQKLFVDFLENKISIKRHRVYETDYVSEAPEDKGFFVPDDKIDFFKPITRGSIYENPDKNKPHNYDVSYASFLYIDLKINPNPKPMNFKDKFLLKLFLECKKNIECLDSNDIYRVALFLAIRYFEDNTLNELITLHERREDYLDYLYKDYSFLDLEAYFNLLNTIDFNEVIEVFKKLVFKSDVRILDNYKNIVEARKKPEPTPPAGPATKIIPFKKSKSNVVELPAIHVKSIEEAKAILKAEEAPEEEEAEEITENYYIRNLETSKLEVYFNKYDYKNLSTENQKKIKSFFLWSSFSNCWISKAQNYPTYLLSGMDFLKDLGSKNERLTFEEKMTNKIAKAEKRAVKFANYSLDFTKKSNEAYKTAKNISSYIPLGQPIMVGHHSERRHRADIKRIDNSMRTSYESQKKAEYYESISEGVNDYKTEFKNPVFIMNRINEAEKDIRMCIREKRDLEKSLVYKKATEKLDFYKKKLEEIGGLKYNAENLLGARIIFNKYNEAHIFVKINKKSVTVKNGCNNYPVVNRCQNLAECHHHININFEDIKKVTYYVGGAMSDTPILQFPAIPEVKTEELKPEVKQDVKEILTELFPAPEPKTEITEEIKINLPVKVKPEVKTVEPGPAAPKDPITNLSLKEGYGIQLDFFGGSKIVKVKHTSKVETQQLSMF